MPLKIYIRVLKKLLRTAKHQIEKYKIKINLTATRSFNSAKHFWRIGLGLFNTKINLNFFFTSVFLYVIRVDQIYPLHEVKYSLLICFITILCTVKDVRYRSSSLLTIPFSHALKFWHFLWQVLEFFLFYTAFST